MKSEKLGTPQYKSPKIHNSLIFNKIKTVKASCFGGFLFFKRSELIGTNARFRVRASC
jgi:hypothetical protein